MRIRRLPSAVADVDSIWAYVSERNPPAADRLVERFTAATARLEDYPHSGRQHDELGPIARGITVGSYTVLYRVTDEWVEIVRVVHGAQDLRTFADDFS